MEKINIRRRIAYQKSFETHGFSPKALQWKDSKAQDKRFVEILADIDLEGKTILDWGCGFGDIITNISNKTKSFEYTGVDIVSEFIKAATTSYKTRSVKRKKAKIEFLERDLEKNPLNKKFDVVMTCGTLNSQIKKNNLGKDFPRDSLKYRKKIISTLWDYANEVFVFNMAGGFPQPENKATNKVWYADSLEVLEFCFSLTSKIIFRHHYHRRDFTIVMFK